jgi:hypothetical protein
MAGLAQTKERQIAELKRRLEESEANTQGHDSSDAQQPARKKSKSSNIEEENGNVAKAAKTLRFL